MNGLRMSNVKLKATTAGTWLLISERNSNTRLPLAGFEELYDEVSREERRAVCCLCEWIVSERED